MNIYERLGNYAADDRPEKCYLDSEFWLTGAYGSYKTDTLEFIPIGSRFVSWLWRAGEHNIWILAQEMLSTASVPRHPTQKQLLRHAWERPRDIYTMKGTIMNFASLDTNDPRYLSEEVRKEMAEYAGVHPYLADVLRVMSVDDFADGRGGFMTSEELRRYRNRMPGRIFIGWERLFPWLIDRIYSDIQRDATGKVIQYTVQPVSSEYRHISEDLPFDKYG